jgi:hypothetical protein
MATYKKFSDAWRCAPKTFAGFATFARVEGENSKSDSSRAEHQKSDLEAAKVAQVAKVAASGSEKSDSGAAKATKVAKVGTPDAVPEDGACAQCHGNVDSKERRLVGEDKAVWLHPECDRFWLEDHAPLDIPADLRRCEFCGKPGAQRWNLHGRSVFLHEHCTDAWADQHHRAPDPHDQKGDRKLQDKAAPGNFGRTGRAPATKDARLAEYKDDFKPLNRWYKALKRSGMDDREADNGARAVVRIHVSGLLRPRVW